MNIYQGGPMRGYDNYNYQAFEDGKAYLGFLGHHVESPHDFDMQNGFVSWRSYWMEGQYGVWLREFEWVTLTNAFTPEKAMRLDIASLLRVDAVSFLPGWQYSTGARNEYAVAKMIGLPIWEHKPWSHFHPTEPRSLQVSLMDPATLVAVA